MTKCSKCIIRKNCKSYRDYLQCRVKLHDKQRKLKLIKNKIKKCKGIEKNGKIN